MVLGGQRVDTAFLLKGAGTKGRLTIARLGKNGDQMIRMANSPAQLLVVQHVGPIDEAVRTNLIDLVTARRSKGRQLTGTVWDGVECARLFVAYGMIDGATGAITQAGTAVLDRAEKGASH